MKRKSNSIWDKKASDLTLGEAMKVTFWTTIISVILGCLPFGIAALCEAVDSRKNEKALRSAPADDDNEEETSD